MWSNFGGWGCEGVQRFAGADGGARLVSDARKRNTVAALPKQHGTFVALKLIHQAADEIRKPLHVGGKRSAVVTRSRRVRGMASKLRLLTDLHVTTAHNFEDVLDWNAELRENEVIVVTSSVMRKILEHDVVTMENLNILVLDSCHSIYCDPDLKAIMEIYNKTPATISKPRILGLTYPLFTQDLQNINPNVSGLDNKQSLLEENVSKSNDTTDNSSSIQEIVVIERNIGIDNQNSPTMNKKSATIQILSQEEGVILNDEIIARCNDNDAIAKYIVDTSKDTEEPLVSTSLDTKKLSEIVVKNDNEFFEQIDSNQCVKDGFQKNDTDKPRSDKNDVTHTYSSLESSDINKPFSDVLLRSNSDTSVYEKLECQLERLENVLSSTTDLVDDIEGMKRFFGKPREVVIEFARAIENATQSEDYQYLDKYMRDTVGEAYFFMADHRYDPIEIYGEDLYGEELSQIPNPTTDPKYILDQFIYALNQLGPYGADKAAYNLLMKLDKLKVRIPYERHYLLLCICTTVLVKIRCATDLVFQKYPSELDRIKIFCTPKVQRFAELLKQFKPASTVSPDNDMKIMNYDVGNSPKNTPHDNSLENVGGTMERDENVANNTTNNNVSSKKERKILKNTNEIVNDSSDEVNDNKTMLNDERETESNTTLGDRDIVTELSSDKTKLCEEIDKCDFKFLGKQLEWICNEKLNDNIIDAKLEIEKSSLSSKDIAKCLKNVDHSDVKLETTFDMDTTANELTSFVEDNEENMRKVEQKLEDTTKIDLKNHKNIKFLDQTSGISTDSSKAFDLVDCQVHVGDNLTDNVMYAATAQTVCRNDCLANPLSLVNTAGPRYKGRGRHTAGLNNRARRVHANLNPDALCGIIFVQEALMAKALFSIVVELSRWEPDLWFLCAQYSAPEKVPDPIREPKDAELHRKRQEDVLRKFRMHDCNLLLANSALEEGIEMPRCNLVVRWDPPNGYRSYALCRAKGRALESVAAIFAENSPTNDSEGIKDWSVDKVVADLAIYMELDQMVARRSGSEKKENESLEEESRADMLSCLIKPYSTGIDGAAVDLNGAIALVNRYCCKLPSDTFTRLAPHWTVENLSMTLETGTIDNAYVCTLRLPINCPIKYNIVGHPMPTKALARRIAALQACRILHMSGELDEFLMPIGKENFKTPAWVWAPTPAADLARTNAQKCLGVQDPARPGTTKRRQYYFKKTAWSLSDCRPFIKDDPVDRTEHKSDSQTDERTEKVNLLYAICCKLVCPLPERYNTRGRKLHAPENSKQGLAILTSRVIKKIPPFLLYTRSGEVLVCLVHAGNLPPLSMEQANKAERFLKFAFADVLRVRRHQMEFVNGDGEKTNNYYVVPTTKVLNWDSSFKIEIDWSFLDLIYEHTEKKYTNPLMDSELWTDTQEDVDESQESGECSRKYAQNLETESNTDRAEEEAVPNLRNPLLKPGEIFVFDPEKYKDAVVTPWYRNQDQPQYFFVAEICAHLSPLSSFPSENHDTFAEYYRGKYGAPITQLQQPLLDVDHTSARLNLLTPRYVNRKGVALPVSSERTRRAKRDRLDQKQILVPELCLPHPFTGALWSAAVALPCILYRINALLIADEIRRSVAISVGLGTADLEDDHRPGFEWPPLDFGWSLADVLSKEKQGQEKIKEKQEVSEEKKEEFEVIGAEGEQWCQLDGKTDKSLNEILQEKIDEENDGFEIGTWSNDMADNVPDWDEKLDRRLPDNLTFCPSSSDIQWGAKIESNSGPSMGRDRTFSMADSDVSYMSSDFDSSDDTDTDSDTETDTDEDLCHTGGLCKKAGSRSVRIEFKSYHEAEAIDIKPISEQESGENSDDDSSDSEDEKQCLREFREYFYGGDNIGDPIVEQHIAKFRESVQNHKQKILSDGSLIRKDQNITGLMPKDAHNVCALTKQAQSAITPIEHISGETAEEAINTKDIGKNENTSINVHSNSSNVTLSHNIEECIDKHEALSSIDKDFITKTRSTDEIIEGNIDKNEKRNIKTPVNNDFLKELFPFILTSKDDVFHNELSEDGAISLETIEKNKRKLLTDAKNKTSNEEMSNLNCFSMKDVDIDSENFVDERITNLGFDSDALYMENAKIRAMNCKNLESTSEGNRILKSFGTGREFDFDFQPSLVGHPGPSPSLILQALTMSNANDGINLERLETIGDSFLKYAITAYLYCAHPNVHEGKLSHMRSKQVSNLNLYRLGGSRKLGPRMIATKFEPHDNWLPPCHRAPTTLVNAATEFFHQDELHNHMYCPVHKKININTTGPNVEPCGIPKQTENEILNHETENAEDTNNKDDTVLDADATKNNIPEENLEDVDTMKHNVECTCQIEFLEDCVSNGIQCGLLENGSCFIPYNLITQHSIPDKSIADCVEALIGAYLIDCGPRGALIFMSWLGIKVLPKYEVVLHSEHPFVKMMEEAEISNFEDGEIQTKNKGLDVKSEDLDLTCADSAVKCDGNIPVRDFCGNLRNSEEDEEDLEEEKDWSWPGRKPGSLKPFKNEKGQWIQIEFGELKAPPSPLLRYVANPEGELERMLSGYDKLESTLGYRFRDRSLLLQALTHASHRQTALTDCYQRLEFLGDAILDYLITRHLYEDARRHSPGALTDLRSALVNNTIFAALAARHGFHKYFNHMSPGLNEVLERYVRIQEENGHSISEEHYLIEEDDTEQAEDVEVPKALGDLFESIAGAIFLDSGMSLSAVWKVYHDLMATELEAFSAAVPKSPVRELLEAEPETAKFGKPERLADGRRVRVCVEVFGRGTFAGVGRNYRIAKGTAARCALRHLNDSRREGTKR